MHDVYEDSCIVDWKPPHDNGGEPIKNYEIEQMDEETGCWEFAGCCRDGTSLKVDGLHKGHKYQFQVKAINDKGTSDPLQTEKATLMKTLNSYRKIIMTEWF